MHAWIAGFLWLLGLAVGSFLNVVVYRLPLGLSLSEPRRSFCPHCRSTIAWHDNIPVLGWLALGGRCRVCKVTISAQYPLVEALAGLAFVLAYFLLFIEPTREGLPEPMLVRDWAYLAAWLVFVAAMISVSAMDIVSYSLDVRVTEFAVAAACVLHALWGRPDFHLQTAQSAGGPAAVAAFLVMLLLLWLTVWRMPPDAPVDTAPAAAADEPPPSAGERPSEREQPTPQAATRTLAVLAVALLVLAAVGLVALSAAPVEWQRLGVEFLPPAALLLMFLTMALAGSLWRPSDEEVHAVIEEEAPQSRQVAWLELRWLLPIGLAGAGAAAVYRWLPDVAATWNAWMSLTPTDGYVPVAGLVAAMHGALIAAGVGWLLRLVFTFVFGREAFGTGDIYILAAAGACAGWDIALLGLLIAVGLAMLSWMPSQLMKSTLMIPFGPPLALGFFVALWVSEPGARLARFYQESLLTAAREQPRMLLLMGGVLLIGFGAAVLAARVVRRALEPAHSGDEDGPLPPESPPPAA
jgi:prepilin signal peptidase PulO-like enzyme (type II secretory pathway)